CRLRGRRRVAAGQRAQSPARVRGMGVPEPADADPRVGETGGAGGWPGDELRPAVSHGAGAGKGRYCVWEDAWCAVDADILYQRCEDRRGPAARVFRSGDRVRARTSQWEVVAPLRHINSPKITRPGSGANVRTG